MRLSAVVSPGLLPATSVAEAGTASDRAKNMVLLSRYTLLKRGQLLEALKLYPEQLLVWSSRRRLAESQGAGPATGGEAS